MLLVTLALQAATPAAPPPERFSILAPEPAQACRGKLPSGDDIVVCAAAEASQRLPLPAERGPPNRPLQSNPNLDGKGALAAGATPCAARQEGCTTGVDIFGAGTAAIRLVQKLVAPDSCCETPGEATNPFALIGDAIGGAKRAAGRKPDKSNRVPIDLSEPPRPRAQP